MAAKSILQYLIKDIEDKKYCERLLLNKESNELIEKQKKDFHHEIELERAAKRALVITGDDDDDYHCQYLQNDFVVKRLQSLEDIFARNPSLISLLKLVASDNSGVHCEPQQQFLNPTKDNESI